MVYPVVPEKAGMLFIYSDGVYRKCLFYIRVHVSWVCGYGHSVFKYSPLFLDSLTEDYKRSEGINISTLIGNLRKD